MNKLFGTIFASLVLLAMAGTAMAQVAAPTLGPVNFPNLYRQNNPATSPWRAHGYAGATVARVEMEAAGAPVSPAAKGSGKQFDLNLVGQQFGLEVSRFDFSASVDASLGGGDLALANTSVLAGMRIGDVVGIGLGHERQEDNSSTGPGPDEDLTLAGVNLRLFGVLFLGAAGGTVKATDPSGVEFDQPLMRYGIGLVFGDANRFHAEWFHESKDAFQDLALGLTRDGRNTDGATVEALLGSFLFGYHARNSETVDTVGTVFGKEKWRTYSVGWYPSAGLSLGAFATNVDITGGGPDQVKFSGVALGWAF